MAPSITSFGCKSRDTGNSRGTYLWLARAQRATNRSRKTAPSSFVKLARGTLIAGQFRGEGSLARSAFLAEARGNESVSGMTRRANDDDLPVLPPLSEPPARRRAELPAIAPHNVLNPVPGTA